MPRLILLAACEKVIMDLDGLVSLITLLERLEVNIPPSIDVPARTALPLRWSIISVWRKDSAEGDYEQKSEVVLLDGTIAMHTEPQRITWAPPSVGAKSVSNLTSIPITDGSIEVRLSYRKIGDIDWTLLSTYPIEILLTRK